jgi:hypothetical protein
MSALWASLWWVSMISYEDLLAVKSNGNTQ